ncbi:hypothetical protein GCM10009554_81600 [Kribbella koreensis]|uniref:Fibronectin type-III domain-containing protein n=1 Tax=Kribbella koreensis TaxID=57909 RepID=A0ABN1RSS5_9ACTN
MRVFRAAVVSTVVALVGGVVAGAGAAGAEDTKIVSYLGYEVSVPASWPVVDLAKDPTACVRFDRAAVYLGRSTAQSDCPAHLVGRGEGLVLAPLTAPARSSEGELQVAVEGAGVLATAYYVPGADQTARKVLASGRVTATAKRNAVQAPRAVQVTPSIIATKNIYQPAFDICDAPAQSTMDAWKAPNSPYRAIGIYISGTSRGCLAQPNLTPQWVAAQDSAGWQFLLIDVGKQAPCTGFSNKISTTPATAVAEGRTAAANAVAAAQALGFAPRSAIYSDIEHYTTTAACKASVLSYLSGWTQELNSRGYVGGAYVGASSGGADLASAYTSTAYTRPDNLWFAHWKNTPVLTSRFIPAGYWAAHQRVHQNEGDVSRTYNGVTLSVDENMLDLTMPPAAVTGVTGTGRNGSAVLRWTLPSTTISQVVVRRNAGKVAPALPTSGTAVYAGPSISAVNAGGLVSGTGYTFRIWVKDKYGKFSPGADKYLAGTSSSAAASAASIMYTGSVTLKSQVKRLDTGAVLSGVPVTLYAKAINASKWTAVATVTSSTTGAVAAVHKPSVTTRYMWTYNGRTDVLGSASPIVTVAVHPAMSSYLSPAAIKLGASSVFYGYLNPAHAGTKTYLQRKSGTKWVAVTNAKLSANGKYTYAIKPTARGTYTYRVVWLADADHQGTQTVAKVLTVS